MLRAWLHPSRIPPRLLPPVLSRSYHFQEFNHHHTHLPLPLPSSSPAFSSSWIGFDYNSNKQGLHQPEIISIDQIHGFTHYDLEPYLKIEENKALIEPVPVKPLSEPSKNEEMELESIVKKKKKRR